MQRTRFLSGSEPSGSERFIRAMAEPPERAEASWSSLRKRAPARIVKLTRAFALQDQAGWYASRNPRAVRVTGTR